MCNCDDFDGPSCFQQKIRRARKEHPCCECGKAIPAGASYEHTSGVWDGAPESFKTCLRCVDLRTAHIDAEGAFGEVCAPTLGNIREAIGECMREDDGYRLAFRESLRRRRKRQEPIKFGAWKAKPAPRGDIVNV